MLRFYLATLGIITLPLSGLTYTDGSGRPVASTRSAGVGSEQLSVSSQRSHACGDLFGHGSSPAVILDLSLIVLTP